MGKIFVLITQFQNPTNRLVNFRVNDGYCPLPDLPPGKTRNFKLSKILRCCRQRGHPDWTIDVLVDGVFTGMQLKPKEHVLRYARIVFKIETDGDGLEVACIAGVPENLSDFFFRHKYFGWMRNRVWDQRACEQISRADSKLAKKLRDLEPPAQKLDTYTHAIKRDLKLPAQNLDPYTDAMKRDLKLPAQNLDPYTDAIKRDLKLPAQDLDSYSDAINRDLKLPARNLDPYTHAIERDLKLPAQNLDPFPDAMKRQYPSPEKLKGHKTKGQTNVITSTAAIPKSKNLQPTSFDRTAAGARRSPDPMVNNGSHHIGLHRPPIMRDDNLEYDRGSYMDSFIHGFLFIIAFAMVSLGALYI